MLQIIAALDCREGGAVRRVDAEMIGHSLGGGRDLRGIRYIGVNGVDCRLE